MPYSKAHYFLVLLLVLTFLGFWNSYFGMLTKAPLTHHFHGITATLWIFLLIAQSWSIHSQRRELHKFMGKALFILVPIMTGAFALVTWVGAQKSIGGHPFYTQFGQALLTADVLLLFSTSLQIYLALRFRNNIRLHSALMLGTVFGLIGPIVSRLVVNWIPGYQITGLETMSNFGYGLNFSIVVSVLIPLVLYFMYKREGWPWLLATGIVVLMYGLYATLGKSDIWASAVQLMSYAPPMAVFAFGLIVGLSACLMGWIHGIRVNR